MDFNFPVITDNFGGGNTAQEKTPPPQYIIKDEDGNEIPKLQTISAAELGDAMARPEYQPVASAYERLEQAIEELTDEELTDVVALMLFGRDRYFNVPDGYKSYKQAQEYAKTSMSERAGDIAYLAGKKDLAEYLGCGLLGEILG
jgi:hypothetical protein